MQGAEGSLTLREGHAEAQAAILLQRDVALRTLPAERPGADQGRLSGLAAHVGPEAVDRVLVTRSTVPSRTQLVVADAHVAAIPIKHLLRIRILREAGAAQAPASVLQHHVGVGFAGLRTALRIEAGLARAADELVGVVLAEASHPNDADFLGLLLLEERRVLCIRRCRSQGQGATTGLGKIRCPSPSHDAQSRHQCQGHDRRGSDACPWSHGAPAVEDLLPRHQRLWKLGVRHPGSSSQPIPP
mmetsp:Transcript_13166/g.36081  ORF Transcript_13166/g.36081 Transcript_13166/m.36081 type:complete len:244 (-) Transcript_13166:229-960(-)